MAFSMNPIAGLTLDGIEPTQTNTGLEVTDNEGRQRRLVTSVANIIPCGCVAINSSNAATLMTPALAITAALVGWAPVSVSISATGQYFWAILNGPVRIRVAASCVNNIPLYTTDTAGVLDDATVSLSQFQVMGVELNGGSNSAAGASNILAVANNPLIRNPKQGP